MAIAKMKKVTLVASKQHQANLLSAIQELQTFEIANTELTNDSLDELGLYTTVDEQMIASSEELFHSISNTLKFLEAYQVQPSFVQKHKHPKPVYTLAELETTVEAMNISASLQVIDQAKKRLQKIQEEMKQAQDKEELLRKWSQVDFHLKACDQFEHIALIWGTIPQTTSNQYRMDLESSEKFFVQEIYHTKDEIGIVVAYAPMEEASVREELQQAHFTVFLYPYNEKPTIELEQAILQQEQLRQEEQEVRAQLKGYVEIREQLELAQEYVYNQLEREKSKALFIQSSHFVVLNGWLPEKQSVNVQEQLQCVLPQSEYIYLAEDITEEEYEKVPILLENHPVIAPFESLIEMYGLPKYGEIDPTPFTAPFYMVFFGMMSGDVGYGLLLWLATFALLKGLHLEKGFAKTIRFFHLLSYPTMLWGFVFGSFFGVDLPFKLISLQTDLISVMVISVIFGVIQLLVGLAVGAYSNLQKRDYANAYLSHIGWIAIILGIVGYVIGGLTSPMLAVVGQWVAIIAAVGILVVSILTHANKGVGVAVGLYNLYGISGYIADVVSYTRLMALAVSGGSIAGAFNMLVGFLPPAARFTAGILLLVLLHGLNIFLTFLGAYVHGLRLQFVEFFGKFYESGGRAFQPFKTYERYISIQTMKKEKMEE